MWQGLSERDDLSEYRARPRAQAHEMIVSEVLLPVHHHLFSVLYCANYVALLALTGR